MSVLITVAGCATASTSLPPILRTNQPVADSISAGESRTYRLNLDANSFIRVYVRQDGVDLRAVLVGPNGETVAVADGPGGAKGNELLVARTKTAGEHRVIVSLSDPADNGAFVVGLLERRAAHAEDHIRAIGLRALASGSQLYSQAATRPRRQEALQAYTEAADSFRQIDDQTNLAWALLYTARAQLSLENWAPAQRAAKEAAGLFKEIAADEAYIAALSNLAQAQEGLANFDGALETFDTTVAYYRAQIDATDDEAALADLSHNLAVDLNNRGRLLTSQGLLDRAEADYREAWERWHDIGGHRAEEVMALLNLGKVHRLKGELERAFRLYERGARLVGNSGARHNEVHLLGNLGRYYLATGELEKASESLQRGLEGARALGNARYMQAITQNLGLLAEVVGDRSAAIRWFRQSLELSRSIGLPSLLSESYLDLGRIQAESGLIEQSLSSLRQAMELAVRADAPPLKVTALREIATVEARSGELERAQSTIEATEPMWAQIPEALRSAVLRTRAEILQRSGDSASALTVLNQAVGLDLALQDRFERGAVLVQLASLERAEGLPERALSHLEAAVELHERIRSRVTTPELRENFLARRRNHYVELIDVLIELESQHPGHGYAVRAFAVSEQSRARTLVELLTESQVQVRKGVPDHLRQREQALLTELSLLHGELLQLKKKENSTNKLRTSLEDALRDATQNYELFEQEIRRTWSGYASLRYPATVGLDDVQALLSPDGSLLQYVLGPERSFVFLVQPSRFEVHVLPSGEVLESHVEEVRQLLRRTDPRTRLRLEHATRLLYDLLISPVEDALLDKPTTWVVPDGNLFYLPFEILQDSRGELVLNKMTVSYVPSATVLSSLRKHLTPPMSNSFVGFGGATGSRDRMGLPELPGTIQELESIASLFPGHATVYAGQTANQDLVFDNPIVSNARWLHFASHGLIREDSPLQSAILLSPDAKGDALLQAAEIFNLRITSNLVVLSACQTGLGRAVRGEGLIGLSRAFFYAGTVNVIVSLWKVDDSATAALMHHLYRNLSSGDPPNEALRKAKMQLVGDSSHKDPRLWAPFIVVGRGV